MNKIIFVNLYIFIFAILSSSSAISQDDSDVNFAKLGIIGGGSYLWNETNLPLYDNFSQCGTYSNGQEMTFFAGLNFSYPLYTDFLMSDLRIFYENRPIYLEATTDNLEVYDSKSGEYKRLVRLHEYDGDLQYIAIDLGFIIKPFYFFDSFKDFPFNIRFGIEAGNPIAGTEYVNSETIKEPLNVLYSDDTKRFVKSEGEILDVGTALGVSAAIQYEVNLNQSMSLTPEIMYRYGINSIIRNSDWNTNILRVGVNLAWNVDMSFESEEVQEPEPEVEIEIIEPEIVEDIPEVPNTLLYSFEPDHVDIVETVVTQTFPILPYIFFDSTSFELRSTYIEEDKPLLGYKGHSLPYKTMGIYYHILDIVGQRMKDNKDLQVKIVGHTDGNEIPDSDKRIVLAGNRAKAVADYFIDKWNISERRINYQTKDKPVLPTSEVYAEGFQENRRVELLGNSKDLLEPVIQSKFLEFKSNPALSFELEINPNIHITDWSLAIRANNEIIFNKTYSGQPPAYHIVSLTADLLDKIGNNDDTRSKVEATIFLRSNNGDTETNTKEIELHRSRNDFEVGRLNLIVFDFDRSDISNQNRLMIEDFVKEAIHSNSEVKIVGSTDILGEKNYNKELSLSRAESVRDLILSIIPNAKILEVNGVGSEKAYHINTTPEGRFYNRTVLIEVKTSLK